MSTIIFISGLIIAVGLTALVIPPLRKMAVRHHWVDEPDGQRKLHREPIPTVGGIAIFIGFIAAISFSYAFRWELPFGLHSLPVGLWIAAGLMVFVGAVDDMGGLGFRQKLIAQIVAALILIHAGYRIDFDSLQFLGGDTYVLSFYSSALTLLWIVGVINAVNLLDGLDGLAAGASIIGLLALSVMIGLDGRIGLMLPALLLVGALAGFLYHNFNPASIFMGDSGSLLIGLFLAVYSIESQGHADPVLGLIIPVVALGLPVLDTNLSIVRRLASKRDVFSADRDHIHHRLLLSFSPRTAVYILYAAAFVYGCVAVTMKISPPNVGYLLLAVTALLSAIGVYAMGYITVRPLLYGLGDRIFGGDLNSSSENPPDPATETRVNTTSAGSSIKRSPSSGDGVIAPSLPTLKPSIVSDVFDATTIVVAVDGLTEADLGNESVLLDLNSGNYYGLNEVGARIFQIIQQPTSIEEIISLLTREYDVAPARLQQDVLSFLQMLHEKQLIDLPHGTAA